MGILPSFLLTVAAVALGIGWGVSLLSLALLPSLRGRRAALRADAAALAGVLPAVAALAAGAAVALPSLRYAVGAGDDHCADHLHHLHLCWAHAHPLPWSLGLPLALLLATVPLQLAQAAIRLWRVGRVAARLVRLGERAGGIVWLPGTRAICHTVGLVSPVILLSRPLEATLSPEELEAAVQHERAHAARRDPAWGALLALCAASGVPGIARRWIALRAEAAEQIADDAAAARVGAGVVAAALLKVARLQIAPIPAPAFGAGGLEARVRRLLDGPEVPRPARAPAGLALLIAAAAGGVALGHDPAHHLIEAAVSLLIR